MENTNKLKLIITRGLPASGKTTFAKGWVAEDEANRIYIEKDDIRNHTELFKDGVYDHKRGDEFVVIRERDRLISEALSQGKSVISSDTNLISKHILQMSNIAKEYDAEVEIKDFTNVPIKELLRRDKLRQHPVGEQVLRKMFHENIKTLSTFLKFNPDLPFVVISDLDGTLTLGPKNRSPYDWSKVGNDDINLGISHILDGVKNIDYCKIMILSGRDSVCRPETEAWLKKNCIDYDELYMRPEGDNRSDEIIKAEMIEEHIRNKYNILIWFDDRARVSIMLRDVYGINVAQVGDVRWEY